VDGENLKAYKEMLRLVKFIWENKDYCLKFNPIYENEESDLAYFSDINWLSIRRQDSV
jgi:hypothetical protein